MFSCTPNQGTLLEGEFDIVTIRFNPKTHGKYVTQGLFILNDSTDAAIGIGLSGICSKPKLILENKGQLYFKQTCVGTLTSRSYLIHNASRVPLMYQWDISPEFKSILHLYPPSGILQGNEKLNLTCSFTPKKAKGYFFKANCLVTSNEGNHDIRMANSSNVELTVHGEGSKGTLSFIPENVDFGDVLVSNLRTVVVYLENSSDCYVHFAIRIRVDQIVGNQEIDFDEWTGNFILF